MPRIRSGLSSMAFERRLFGEDYLMLFARIRGPFVLLLLMITWSPRISIPQKGFGETNTKERSAEYDGRKMKQKVRG